MNPLKAVALLESLAAMAEMIEQSMRDGDPNDAEVQAATERRRVASRRFTEVAERMARHQSGRVVQPVAEAVADATEEIAKTASSLSKLVSAIGTARKG
jgi:Flp pilus assembly CpaF family ATPase